MRSSSHPSVVFSPRLAVVLPEREAAFAAALGAVSPHLSLISAAELPDADVEYVYAPDCPAAMLSIDALRNALLCLAHRRLDFLLVSHGFAEAPALEIVSPANSIVLSVAAYRQLRESGRLPAAARGHLARLLPAPRGVRATRLEALGLGEIRVGSGELSVRGTRTAPLPGFEARQSNEPLFHSLAGARPTVLVLPIMLAVGGVERNLIEIMKRLHERFSFVVVTTERVMAERGSLNHQIAPYCDALFELGELAPQGEFMALLDSIAQSFRPDLVFICNGSPWLLSHTRALRQRFADVPIVDQQVYDEREGWIEFYGDPGIRSFDRFVAINRRIEAAFRNRIGIDPERIDLIHHAIDDARFNLGAAQRWDPSALTGRLGLPAGCRVFGQVGRLTAQKRPLDFLDLARRAQAAGLDDCFLLVGNGEQAAACDEYRERHGLANVRHIPFWEDMSGLYPLLDGIVVTSEYEGLPVVVLEALAMGVPVLATDVGDVRLVLEEYDVGGVVERVGDGPALFRAFTGWRASIEVWKSRARECAPRIASRFSSSAAAAAYELCWEKAWGAYASVGRVVERGAESMPGAMGARSRQKDLASVSVVIPTYNRSQLLMQTLESCQRHAGELDLELVVVDDGSRDDTAERLSELEKSTPNLVWRSVPNRGPGLARNLGASLASREVVLFMGDDIQPENGDFFQIHAEVHGRNRERSLAVLGKVVWPNRPEGGVNFVMAHVQGKGGEQFGYADLHPFSFVDWRMFYTANVSVKRSLVQDWITEGFSSEFSLAAYEDAEFAYRMTLRDPPLRILYTPASVGMHLHPFTVNEFMKRQVSAGMMARVFADLHPGMHVRYMIGLGGVHDAICQPVDARQDEAVADYLSVVEGIKSWARLIESQLQLGSQHWHDDLLRAVFHLCYLQGFVLSWSRSDGNLAAAYRFAIDEFMLHMNRVIHIELTGAALDQRRDVSSVLSLRSEEVMSRSRSRLRHWARSKPWIAGPYRLLRRWLQAV